MGMCISSANDNNLDTNRNIESVVRRPRTRNEFNIINNQPRYRSRPMSLSREHIIRVDIDDNNISVINERITEYDTRGNRIYRISSTNRRRNLNNNIVETFISTSTDVKGIDINKFNNSCLNQDKSDSEVCSICLCPCKKNEFITTLPCNHYYHKDCLKLWFDKHSSCPLCKKEYK